MYLFHRSDHTCFLYGVSTRLSNRQQTLQPLSLENTAILNALNDHKICGNCQYKVLTLINLNI